MHVVAVIGRLELAQGAQRVLFGERHLPIVGGDVGGAGQGPELRGSTRRFAPPAPASGPPSRCGPRASRPAACAPAAGRAARARRASSTTSVGRAPVVVIASRCECMRRRGLGGADPGLAPPLRPARPAPSARRSAPARPAAARARPRAWRGSAAAARARGPSGSRRETGRGRSDSRCRPDRRRAPATARSMPSERLPLGERGRALDLGQRAAVLGQRRRLEQRAGPPRRGGRRARAPPRRRWPAAAARRSRWWSRRSGVLQPSLRSSRSSPDSNSARIVSSAKKTLPPVAPSRRAANRTPPSLPDRRCTSCSIDHSSKAASVQARQVAFARRSPAARRRHAGCPPARALRAVASTPRHRSGSWRRRRARWASSSRLDASAHCRSSNTTVRAGPAASASAWASASSRRVRASAGAGRAVTRRRRRSALSSGSSRARSRLPDRRGQARRALRRRLPSAGHRRPRRTASTPTSR